MRRAGGHVLGRRHAVEGQGRTVTFMEQSTRWFQSYMHAAIVAQPL